MAMVVDLPSGISHSYSFSDSQEEPTCFGRFVSFIQDPTLPATAHSVCGLMRSVAGVVQHFFDIASQTMGKIGGTQFTAVFLMPFCVADIFGSISGIFSATLIEAKVDSFFSALGAISEGADGVANITEALASVGAVSTEVFAWAGPLTMVAAGISAIYIAISVKAFYNNKKMLRDFRNAKVDSELGDGKKISRELLVNKLNSPKRKYYLKTCADINANQVLYKINAVKDEIDSEVRLKKIYRALSNRVKGKQACHALSVVMTLVGIAASAILFATTLTPWVIAGCTLLGLLYILAMTKMAVDASTERTYKQILKDVTAIA